MTIKKLRNKGTGKIGYLYANKDVNYQVLDENDCVLSVYDTLPRLIEEWEDYKLNIWYNSTISGRYTIEIDFATGEEAKKAMGKLKAWERLKDKGFKFNGVEVFSEGLLEIDGVLPALEGADNVKRLKMIDDLYLLFPGDDENE